MSKQIENRVVKMEFDNAKFEKNIKQTSESIKNFNEQLKFKDTAKHFSNLETNFDKTSKSGKRNFDAIKNAGKEAFSDLDKSSKTSLKGLQGTLNGIKFDKISDNIDNVKVKISAMQVAAVTAISNVTTKAMNSAGKLKNNVIGQILSGGKTRALNIENAKFKIENLGKSWEKLYKDMDYAVTGTAYGIDQAASAAAQFSASGIEAGRDMKDALRGISGVASMTGSSFDEIANIFTSIAGKGKAQAEDLSRIAIRGVNAYAALAKELKVSEATVHDMASKGAIDFKTFARIMNKEFGESATKANNTFQGALSNTKAALSRVGEAFYTSYHENARLVLLDVMPVINQFKNVIAPKNGDKLVKNSIMGVITRGMDELRKRIVNFLKVIQKNKSWTNILTNLGKAMDRSFSSAFLVLDNFIGAIKTLSKIVKYFIDPVKKTFYEFFPSKDRLKNFAAFIKTFTGLAEVFSKGIKNLLMEKDPKGNWDPDTNALYSLLRMIFTVLKSIGKLGGLIAYDLVHLLDLLFSGLAPFGHYIFDFLEDISNKIIKLDTKIKESKKISIIIGFIHRAMGKLEIVLRRASDEFKPFLTSVKELYHALKEKVHPELKKFKDFINRALEPIFDKMDKAFRNTEEWVEAPARAIRDATATIKAKAIEIKDGSSEIKNSAKGAKDAINEVGDKSFLQTVWSGISWFFERMGEGLQKLKSFFKGQNNEEGLWDKLKKIFGKAGEVLRIIWEKVSPEIKKVANVILDSSSSGLDSILKYLKTHDILAIVEKIAKIFLTGAFGRLLWKFSDPKKASISQSLAGMFAAIRSTFMTVNNAVNSILKDKSEKTKIEKVKNLFQSISGLIKSLTLLFGTIAASLFLLSFIDQDKLNAGLGLFITITSLVAGLAIAIMAMQKKLNTSRQSRSLALLKDKLEYNSNENVFTSIAKIVAAIGSMFLLISASIMILSKVNPDRQGFALTTIGAIGVFIGSIISGILGLTKRLELRDKELEALPEILKQFGQVFKAISKAMLRMAIIVFAIGKGLSPGEVVKGTATLGVITLAMMGIMYATAEMNDKLIGTDKYGKEGKKSESVTVITTATKFLSSIGSVFFKMGLVCLALGKLTDSDSWWRGVGALSIIAAIVMGVMAATRLISDKNIGADRYADSGKISKYKLKGLLRAAKKDNGSFSTNASKAVTTLREMTEFLSTVSNAFIKMGLVCLALGKLTNGDEYLKGIAGISLFTVLILGIINTTKNIEGKDLKYVSMTVLAISAGLIVLAAAFKQISEVEWDGLGKGFAALIGFAAVLFVASAIAKATKLGEAFERFGKALLYCGVGMAAISTAIYLFIRSWKMIKDLKLDKTQLINMFKEILSIMPSLLRGLLSGMVDLLIGFIVDVVESLTERMEELVSIISKFMHTLFKAIKAVTGEFDIKEVIEALVAVAVVFAMTWMLSQISKNVKGSLKGIAIMAVVLTALTVMFSLLLNGKKGMGKEALEIGLGMAAVVLAVAEVAGTLAAVSKIVDKTKIEFGSVLKAAGIILIAFALLGVMTAALTLVMNWIGNMMRDTGPNTIDEVKKNIASVFDVLSEITKGLGNLIGSFVGSAFERILGGLGSGLSSFMTNATYFITEAKKLKASDFNGILKLSEVIFSLIGGGMLNSASKYIDDPSKILGALLGGNSIFGMAGKIVNGLYNGITGTKEEDSSPLVKLAKELEASSTYFRDFGNTITQINNPSKMATVSQYIGQSIGYLQEHLPWEVEAFWGFFSKKQVKLSDFGQRMNEFLGDDTHPAFIAFVNKLKDLNITIKAVTKAQLIGQCIKNLQENLPWDNTEFKAFVSGLMSVGFDYSNKKQTSLSDFGKGLSDFSESFSTFVANIQGITKDDMDKASAIGVMIATIVGGLHDSEMQIKASRFEGFALSLKGMQSITEFASQLAKSTPDLISFVTDISNADIPSDLSAVMGLVDIIKAFFTITEGQTIHENGVFEYLFGRDKKVTLSEMVKNLNDAIPAFEKLSDSLSKNKIKKVTEEQKNALTSTIDAVSIIIKGLPGKEEDWAGIIEKGSENLSAIKDFLLGYIVQTKEYGLEGTQYTSAQDTKGKATTVNHYVDGIIDLAAALSLKLSRLEKIDPNKLSWYTTVLNESFKFIKGINTDELKNLVKENSGVTADQVGTWITGLGNAVLAVCENAATLSEYSSKKRLTKADLAIFGDFTGAVKNMFKAFHEMTSEGVLRSDGAGSYADVVSASIAPMNVLIDKFAGLNDKIDATSVKNITSYFNAVISEYKNVKGHDLKAIEAVNQAFANLTTNAFEGALNSSGLLDSALNPNDTIAKAKTSQDAKNLARYYNYILLGALDTVNSGLTSKNPSLNGIKLHERYSLGPVILGILTAKVDKQNNSLVRAIVDSVNNAYNKVAYKTRKPGSKGADSNHNFWQLGHYICEGIRKGILDGRSDVINSVVDMAIEMYAATCAALEISSPSKKFMNVGIFSDDGIALGAIKNAMVVRKAGSYIANVMTNSASSTIRSNTDYVASDFGDILMSATSMAVDNVNKGFTAQNALTPTISPVVTDTWAPLNFNGNVKMKGVSLSPNAEKELNRVASSLELRHEQKISVDNGDVVNAINRMDKRFIELENAIGSMRVSLDSDKVVGGISTKMNKSFGTSQYLAERGV